MHRSLAVAVALLVVGGSLAAGTVSASNDSVDDGATFTVETGKILLQEDGRICAEKEGRGLNKVTIYDARLVDVTLYQNNSGDNDVRLEMNESRVDEMVIWSNGENARVNTLALTGGCIRLDQPTRTVLEATRLESVTYRTEEMEIITGRNAASGAPEPGGLRLGGLRNNSSTDDSSDAPGDLQRLDGVDENGSSVDETVNGTVENTTDEVADTVDGTVNETTDAVDNTTNDTTDTVDNTTDDATDVVDTTVDDTADAVDNTTDTDTVDDTTDATAETQTATATETQTTETQTTETGEESSDGGASGDGSDDDRPVALRIEFDPEAKVIG